jgi:transposase
MTRETAWSLCGTRAVGEVPRQRGKTLTVVGAIALDGVRAMMAYEGGTDRTAFLRFVHDALVPTLRRGDVVVWDNLGAHKAHGVREAIEAVGASILWLPPYHPELNPIELAWTKLKRLLRAAAARSYQALACALKHATELITPHDTAGWLRHCGHGQVV